MYRSSADQIFARVLRIRARAQTLLLGKSEVTEVVPEADAEAERVAMALAGRVELRLPRLVALFGMAPLAEDVVVALVATEFDPFMRTLLRSLQRELGRPWIELGTIAELLELPLPRVPELCTLFAPDGALRRYALVMVDESVEAPAVATRVKLAGRLARHLVGDDSLPPWTRRVEPRDLLSRSLADATAVRALCTRARRALEHGEPLAIELCGARGTGRRFLAEGLAHQLGLPLLVCDMGRFPGSELAERLGEARRESILGGALLCLSDWDAHLPQAVAPEEGQPSAVAGPRRLPPPLAEYLESLEGPVVLTTEEREPLLERHAPAVFHVDLPFPSPSQRAALLREALAEHHADVEEGDDLLGMAQRFALDPARIQVAARMAVELSGEGAMANADAAEDAPRTISRADLTEACRRQLRHDLKSLAVRVTASHKWEDLVIPVDVYHALREMIAYVKHGHRVYEEWGFGSRHSLSQGVSALFAGPPGTGKTMCASVMARELDMELFRVDLSRIVSKWIGETEKNLAKVFDEAQRSNAIILFDEADSLFAKRTEVKSSVDRYANLEVNFLLQRMEAFGGVTLLTTNFEDTIDTAFKRRLTFRMRFEKPDAEARTSLWRKVFPPGCRLAPGVDFARVAAEFEMSGGNIRNAAVRAAFLAAADGTPVTMEHVLTAAERESREMGLLTRSGPAPRAVIPVEGPPPASPPSRLRPLQPTRKP